MKETQRISKREDRDVKRVINIARAAQIRMLKAHDKHAARMATQRGWQKPAPAIQQVFT